jgi:cobalt-zinc-cadmium efflux system membrane fusion protein
MTHEHSAPVPSSGLDTPGSPARRRPLLLGALAVAAAAVAMLALRRGNETVADTGGPFSVAGDRVEIRDNAPTWTYLEFARADQQAPVPPAPVPARVAFDEARAAPIVAPLLGRVDAVPVRLGQRVAKGERLVAIRSPDLVDLTKEVELKRTEEAAKAKAVERLRALVDLHAEPTKKLIDAEQELAQAQLARHGAELKLSSLSIAQDDAGLYWLIAPRDGVVVERDVLTGQEVGPERSEPLMVIAELDEVIVTADVPEGDVAGLQIGESAQVLPTGGAEPGVTGRVEYIGEVVDPQRRMVEVRVRVPNAERLLRPNAFVQVAFTGDDQPRVVVPAEAVVTDDQQSFVFVRNPDQPAALQRREVALGRQRGGRVEIARGLAPGETYVTRGAILLLNAVDLASQ